MNLKKIKILILIKILSTKCYELYDLMKSIEGDQEILEQLVTIGAFTVKDKKILILDDKNNKKKTEQLLQ